MAEPAAGRPAWHEPGRDTAGARKVADGLEQRGYATTERDSRDTRPLNVTLTRRGRDSTVSGISGITELNREVAGRVSPAQLAAADAGAQPRAGAV